MMFEEVATTHSEDINSFRRLFIDRKLIQIKLIYSEDYFIDLNYRLSAPEIHKYNMTCAITTRLNVVIAQCKSQISLNASHKFQIWAHKSPTHHV